MRADGIIRVPISIKRGIQHSKNLNSHDEKINPRKPNKPPIKGIIDDFFLSNHHLMTRIQFRHITNNEMVNNNDEKNNFT
jgi:hypothetical protein